MTLVFIIYNNVSSLTCPIHFLSLNKSRIKLYGLQNYLGFNKIIYTVKLLFYLLSDISTSIDFKINLLIYIAHIKLLNIHNVPT